MKKIFSALLAALMLFSLAPLAFAEDAVVIECSAGETVNAYVGSIAADVTAYENGFPKGLTLAAAQDGAGLALYVTGASFTAGYYYASVPCTDGTTFHLEINIKNDPTAAPVPQMPRITSISRSTQCSLGGEMPLSVEIENPAGYQLSYSWLQNGYIMSGAESAVCMAQTSAEGISSYRCCIQFFANNMINTIYSDEILVKVVDDHIASLYLNSTPYKMNYELGQQLDPEGVSLVVVYADGSYELITDGFTVSPATFDKVGDVPVTLSYSGFTAGFNVNVTGKLEIAKLTLSRPAEKSEYKVGEAFDPTGLAVRAHYVGDFSEAISEDLSFSPEVFTEAGEQYVTVTYKDFTCRMRVDVIDASAPTSVSVGELPDKTEYKEDEELDITGLTLTLEYPNGEEKTVIASDDSAVSCSPTVLEEDGEQEITVTYTTDSGEELKCKFSVQVSDDDDDDDKDKKADRKNKDDKSKKSEKDKSKGSSLLSGKKGVLIAVIVSLVAAGGVAAFLITKDIPLKDDLEDDEEETPRKEQDDEDDDF